MKYYIISGFILLILISAGCLANNKDNDAKSIYVVSMTPDEMVKALQNRTIAGFISWEPIPSRAVNEGYARYLANSKDEWENHPSCVLAISQDFKDEDVIRALIWAEVKGTRFINDPANREKVLDYGRDFSGVGRETFSAVLNNTIYIESPDTDETKRAVGILTEAEVLKKNLSSMGYNNVDEFISELYIKKYYNEIKMNLDKDPEWVPPKVNESLRFGFIEGNSHYFAVYVAQKEGYFDKVGLVPGKNLQFTGYRSGRAITDALGHQEIDTAIVGTTVLLRYKVNDNGRINIINGVNSGGTSLVVRADSDIRSLEDLNGKKIATPGFGTCQDTIMRKMFDGYEIKTQ